MLVDTEGLSTTDLDLDTYKHDVIGLGDVTIMNVKGANYSDIQDISQIASNESRRCMFIHQNVSAVTANESLAIYCGRLQEALNNGVRAAAKLENIANIHTFADLSSVDVQGRVNRRRLTV